MNAPSAERGEEIILAEIRKNARECYRVRLSEFKRFRFVDIRLFYGDEGDRKPSAKGVAIKPDVLPEVIAALQEAQKRLGGAT